MEQGEKLLWGIVLGAIIIGSGLWISKHIFGFWGWV